MSLWGYRVTFAFKLCVLEWRLTIPAMPVTSGLTRTKPKVLLEKSLAFAVKSPASVWSSHLKNVTLDRKL